LIFFVVVVVVVDDDDCVLGLFEMGTEIECTVLGSAVFVTETFRF
jgi:hypothetical protein